MKILINLKNNFFLKLKLILTFLILIPIYILIFFLRSIIKIKFGNIDITRIGHSLNYELYKLYKKENKDFVIWFMNEPICNLQLYNMFKRNYFFFKKFYIIYNTTLFFSKYFKFLKKIIYEIDLYDYKNYLEKKSIQFDFTKDEFIHGNNLLKKIKISKNAKIVCINIRDDMYLKKNFPNKNFSYQNYRDSNIENFIPIIKKLLKKGYFVIRMGKNVKKKMKIKNQNFLDYPFSKFRSDFMDIFLVRKCNFYIGSNTGLDCLAIIFRKPLLSVNMLPISLFYLFKKKILIAPKILYRDKKKLNLHQIFKYNVHHCATTKCYKQNKIVLKELSSSQLLEILKEFIELEKKSWKLMKNAKKLQTIFKKNYLKFLKENEELTFENSLNDKNILGYVSNNFIKKNSWI